jgi:hypothetical protein
MEIEMEPKRIAAVVALTAAMAAPAFAQAAPRSASTQHRLQQERMYRPARYHSAYRYEYQPPYLGNEVGVIADDVTGANPFGAPPYPWAYYDGPYVSFGGPFPNAKRAPAITRRKPNNH